MLYYCSSVHPSICSFGVRLSWFHFQSRTLVIFDGFSSNFAWALILGMSGLGFQMGYFVY